MARWRAVRRWGPSAGALLIAGLLAGAMAPAPVGAAGVTFRTDGIMEVDGQPLFPVGLLDIGYWRYPSDWNDRIRQSGANVVWDVEAAYADTVPSCAALLDSARVTGYRLIVGSGDTWNWDDPSTPELEVDRLMYEVDEVPALLQCLAGGPDQFLGFVNRDEPSWTTSRHMVGDIDQQHVLWTYGQLHQDLAAPFVAMNFAPTHVSGDLLQWEADLAPFLDATDVVLFAVYPYPYGPGTCQPWNVLGYPDCSMDRLPIAADLFLSDINRPGQPLWMIVQAHKGIPLKEARWEAHAAIVHGATGLLWAGWTWYHDLGTGWANWPITVQVMNEVGALQPFLVGSDLPVVSGHPDVDVRAKRGPGRQVIAIAISRNGFSGQVSLQLPNLPASAPVTVWSEGRVLNAVGGAITDNFAAYESHVYQYEGRFGGLLPTPAPVPAGVPETFSVRAFPNPSPGRTVVEFSLPRAAFAAFAVYDAAGRRVAAAGRGSWPAGTGRVVWNGRDALGRPVAPGVYFVRGVTSEGETAAARVLIRR